MASAEARRSIRRCVAGLSNWLAQFGDEEEQNEVIDEALSDADARIQRELHVILGSRRVVCWPEATKVKGVDYEVEEEPYDLDQSEWRAYGFLPLRKRPAQSVQRVRLMLGRDNTVITYPIEWVRLNSRDAQLSIVPTPGVGWQGLLLQTGQYYIPYISAAMARERVPQVIAVDYTVGLGGKADWDEATYDPDYADLRHQRARLAAAEILLDLSQAVAPGIASKSISEDGSSQSVNYARGGKTIFGAHIDAIEADWERFKANWQATNAGIEFVVL